MVSRSLGRWIAVPALLLAGASVHAATVFTTWTSVDLVNDTATGSLGDVSITLAGTGANPGDLSFFDDASEFFSNDFIPVADAGPLDRLEFISSPAPAKEYTLSFGSPVIDPIVHFASLGSLITFTGGVSSITNVPGILGTDDKFIVSGLTVSAVENLPDAFCTVRLQGPVSTVTFTAVTLGTRTIDGVSLQIGADAAVVPAPGAFVLLLTALAGVAARRWSVRVTP